jgi:nucleotide-binding universal stress UspA family protein
MLYNLNMKRKFSKILVAMDGSGSSKNAARYATMMAKKNNSELIAIHILTPDGYAYLFDIPPSDAGSLEELMNISRHVVMNWIDEIKEEEQTNNDGNKNMDKVRLKTEVMLATKPIVGEIVDYAERENIDLIVIGTRGRSGLKKMLLGSVASGVVTYASCPVLVIK